MRVINETHWQTVHVKAIFSRTARRIRRKKREKAISIPPIVLLRFAGNRTPYSGETTGVILNPRQTAMRLHYDPRNPPPTTKVRQLFIPRENLNPVLLARAAKQLIQYGETRRTNGLREEAQSLQEYEWALDLPLDRKPRPPRKSTDERRDEALENAKRRIGIWETKLKLAQTKLKKWRREKRRIEYRIEKATKGGSE